MQEKLVWRFRKSHPKKCICSLQIGLSKGMGIFSQRAQEKFLPSHSYLELELQALLVIRDYQRYPLGMYRAGQSSVY